ncbi:signal recognition particle SRP9/SRP14 subunit [Hysterangium stoloniferum]|nr:signal recognition particle SRP9/SRP14 subunit [Hysterangium stoloniferum]
MDLLDNTTFISKLSSLFSDKKGKGTVWLTHKRYSYEGEDAVMSTGEPEGGDDREYPCLVRATDGKKTQFSTKVMPGDLDKFHAAYGTLLKTSMATLRKRDKKREKQRAEQQAARKRKLIDSVVLQGPKRGNGRRKRQRLLKAALRQEEARKKAAEKEATKAK